MLMKEMNLWLHRKIRKISILSSWMTCDTEEKKARKQIQSEKLNWNSMWIENTFYYTFLLYKKVSQKKKNLQIKIQSLEILNLTSIISSHRYKITLSSNIRWEKASQFWINCYCALVRISYILGTILMPICLTFQGSWLFVLEKMKNHSRN